MALGHGARRPLTPATALADGGAQARPQAAATPHGASRKRRQLQRPGEEPLLSSLLYGLTTVLGPNNARCRFFPHTWNFTFRLQFSIYLHALVYLVLHVHFEALDYSVLTPRLDTTLQYIASIIDSINACFKPCV